MTAKTKTKRDRAAGRHHHPGVPNPVSDRHR